MKLIICEKGSLAKSVVEGLKLNGEKFKLQSGANVSQNYAVVAASGHLFGLADPDAYLDYDKQDGKPSWNKTYEVLKHQPIVPEKWKFNSNGSDAAKKYKLIKEWLGKKEITSVINCGDADREGEVIVRLILQKASNKKPVERLWLPDQAPATIAAAVKKMENDSKYDNLSNEGYARMYYDWITGMNGTRLATIKSGALIRYGRVKEAIVKTIYDREMEIRNFVPKHYLAVSSNEETKGEKIELTSKKQWPNSDKDKAQAKADAFNKAGAQVTNIEAKEKTVGRPKFFSQADLQNAMNKKYGLKPKDTLSLAQSLYDKGYTTYPRTPAQYMADAEKDKAKDIIGAIKKEMGIDLKFRDSKQVFDTSKIESHSGITPTSLIPDLEKLSDLERKCYEIILNRFCAIFAPEDCKVKETTMTIHSDDEDFKIKGTIILQKGWKAFDLLANANDKLLPDLKIGDNVNINFQTVEKETNPPKRYSVSTLNKYLLNPFSKVNPADLDDSMDNDTSDSEKDDSEDVKAIMEGSTIGTEATRAGIIEECVKTGYISLKKSTYFLEPGGEDYITILKSLGMDPSLEETVQMNRDLKKVNQGKLTVQQMIDKAKKQMQDVYAKNEGVTVTTAHKGMTDSKGKVLKEVGKCPECGKPLVERKGKYGKFISCSGYPDCKYIQKGDGKPAPKKLDKLCPECGAPLVVRKGKFGTFLGCSNYPKCKYISKE